MKKGGLGNPLINLQDTTTNLLQPSLLKNHKPKLNLTGNYNQLFLKHTQCSKN